MYKHPFKPLGAPFFESWDNDFKKKGDAIKFIKEDYPQYDLSVSNLITKIVVTLVHPDLVKEFYTNDHLTNYHKINDIKDSFSRFGLGLVFTE